MRNKSEEFMRLAQAMASAAFVQGRCEALAELLNEKDNSIGSVDPQEYEMQATEFNLRRRGFHDALDALLETSWPHRKESGSDEG